MSRQQQTEPDDDPMQRVLEYEETIAELGERDDRIGALARYTLAVAKGEQPDDRDAEMAGLPAVGDDGGDGR